MEIRVMGVYEAVDCFIQFLNEKLCLSDSFVSRSYFKVSIWHCYVDFVGTHDDIKLFQKVIEDSTHYVICDKVFMDFESFYDDTSRYLRYCFDILYDSTKTNPKNKSFYEKMSYSGRPSREVKKLKLGEFISTYDKDCNIIINIENFFSGSIGDVMTVEGYENFSERTIKCWGVTGGDEFYSVEIFVFLEES